jgi:DNA-binding winged helix-turn-helix (wHTH) protein/tetratricopeptide (TPR) repeat protein
MSFATSQKINALSRCLVRATASHGAHDTIISAGLSPVMPKVTSRRFRFEPFEVDFGTAELRRRGIRLRLSGQPLRILEMLIERSGEVVSREELRDLLWKDDTFIDFERGLNAAVNRLREALGDSAAKPRYIETLPRIGYRFIASICVPDPQEPPQTPLVDPAREANGLLTDRAINPAKADDPGLSPSISAGSAEPRRPRRWGGWIPATMIAAVAVALALVAPVVYRTRQRPQFTLSSKDTIVLADFENRTGDPVFDDALRQALLVGLEQSPYLQIVSDRKTDAILMQMGRSPAEKLVGPVAVELCQRSGSRALLQESISTLGAAYLIGLTAIRCDTGEAFVHEQAEASRKEDVIDALDKATRRLRSRLGESLQSIQQYALPLEQATTPSLDALKAFSEGHRIWDKEGEVIAIPFFQRAVGLDPDFAMAYGALAAAYENLGEVKLAEENAAKSYRLRNRASGLERILIESWYHIYVTGDLERATAVSEIAVRTYPGNSRPLNDLGVLYDGLGRYDKALDLFRTSLTLDPSEATYNNLGLTLMAVGRAAEAKNILDEAFQRNFQSGYLLQTSYWNAFLLNDLVRMNQILSDSAEVPGARPLLLCEQANTEAYYGRFSKARQLSHTAANISRRDNPEWAAACLARAAVREAEVRNFQPARELISEALHLSRDQTVTTLAALVMAETGNSSAALAIVKDLSKKRPEDTFVQKYWIPIISAEVEILQNRGARAVDLLSNVEPLDCASPNEFAMSTLYPAYVRGQAYLANRNPGNAALEFQKLIDHKGLTVNYPLSSLAQLGLARAYARTGDLQRARHVYKGVLELWKDADRDLPALKEAQVEYAELQ